MTIARMDGFLSGLLLGMFLGLLLGPIVRSWVLWHAIGEARREASLADAILERMDQQDEPPSGSNPNDAWRA